MTLLRRNFLFFSLLILIFGCQSSKAPLTTIFSQNVMTIDYRIIVGQSLSKEQKIRIQMLINQTMDEINRIYNKWNPQSEISQLNRLQAHQKLAISPELWAFLQRIDQLVLLSEGRFDPTIEPLQQLWKSKLEKKEIPSSEDIEALKPCIGWNKIHFEDGIFYKDDSRTSLDLGGIAKGLCVDLLVERLNKAGFHNLYVEWGGEIRTSGEHPEGRPWQIYIRHFASQDPKQAVAVLSLHNQAIATSGDYHQYWTVRQGNSWVTYCHIFNPLTLAPMQVKPGSVASASLLADDCVTADALAKVTMLFDSTEDAEEWMEKIKNKIPHLAFWLALRE